VDDTRPLSPKGEGRRCSDKRRYESVVAYRLQYTFKTRNAVAFDQAVRLLERLPAARALLHPAHCSNYLRKRELRPEPQRDMRRLHGIADNARHLINQAVEIDLFAHPG
jgi:hypothetical protein